MGSTLNWGQSSRWYTSLPLNSPLQVVERALGSSPVTGLYPQMLPCLGALFCVSVFVFFFFCTISKLLTLFFKWCEREMRFKAIKNWALFNPLPWCRNHRSLLWWTHPAHGELCKGECWECCDAQPVHFPRQKQAPNGTQTSVSSHLIALEMVRRLQQKLSRVTHFHAARTQAGGDLPQEI